MSTFLQKDAPLPEQLKVLFLGDSITDNGLYVAFMDAYFKLHHPGHAITLIPLGVSSETASGLSEPKHPFPRPCVHHRLQRAIQESQPDWVVACYGMNDAIYHPYSEERIGAYKKGIRELIDIVRQEGARIAVMTPPPFDPPSFSGALIGEEGLDFSYLAVYRDYDQVLEKYAQWLGSKECPADACIDIRTPLAADITERRSLHPRYRSGDGIHPNAFGHWVIARALLSSLFHVTQDFEPAYVGEPEQSTFFRLVLEKHELLKAAWKEHVGHTNPNKELHALPLAEAIQAEDRLVRLIREEALKM